MPENLIAQYLTALRADDRLNRTRIEALAADYDAHNPFGPRLVDELAEVAANDMPMAA